LAAIAQPESTLVRAASRVLDERRRGIRPPFGVAPQALRGPGRAGAIATDQWS